MKVLLSKFTGKRASMTLLMKHFVRLSNGRIVNENLQSQTFSIPSTPAASILTPETPRSPLSIVCQPKVSFVRNSFAHNLYLILNIFSHSLFSWLGNAIIFSSLFAHVHVWSCSNYVLNVMCEK